MCCLAGHCQPSSKILVVMVAVDNNDMVFLAALSSWLLLPAVLVIVMVALDASPHCQCDVLPPAGHPHRCHGGSCYLPSSSLLLSLRWHWLLVVDDDMVVGCWLPAILVIVVTVGVIIIDMMLCWLPAIAILVMEALATSCPHLCTWSSLLINCKGI